MGYIFRRGSAQDVGMGSVDSSINLKARVTPNTPNFTWGELLKTDIPLDNTPNETQKANLRDLAELLQTLRNKFGQININSGFRSDAIQTAMNTKSSPYYNEKAAKGRSLHQDGKAADIHPTKITDAELFANILNDPDLLSQVGEITYIDTFIHISTPAPEINKVSYVMKNVPGVGYVHMAASEISDFIGKYASAAYEAVKGAAQDVAEYVSEEPVKSAGIGIAIAAAVAGVVGLIFFMKKK